MINNRIEERIEGTDANEKSLRLAKAMSCMTTIVVAQRETSSRLTGNALTSTLADTVQNLAVIFSFFNNAAVVVSASFPGC